MVQSLSSSRELEHRLLQKFVVVARAIGGSRSATCESLISESFKKPPKINTFYSWTFMRRSAHAIL
jgi:hypothetical protein